MKKTCTIERKDKEITITCFDGQYFKWDIASNVAVYDFFPYLTSCLNDAVKKVVEAHDPRKTREIETIKALEIEDEYLKRKQSDERIDKEWGNPDEQK